ncbi:MAG: serine/threonine-protein kinase [Verrucomicrobiota bacterium]
MTPTDSKPFRACPKCGAAIAATALDGLCPNCLVLVTFDQESACMVATPAPPAAEAAGRQTPPKPLLSSTLRYFGDYELLEEIARGGMGVVYKARQASLNRIVAVKMILGGQLASETDIQRFLTEAEAAANLQHPHIVAIHEIGEHEGRHYFSMDYVEGKNLADYAKDNLLPAARAAQLVKTIAEAIHFAHQRGTLHRDLKPQNVLIDAAGQPRITDFGLAKLTRTDSSLTREGAVMGSPSYMSPEQAAGKNDLVGPSSDVYSIGAMLYHVLTGEAPFKGETPLGTLRKVMEEEPAAPSKLNPKTPPDLETICLKCLEKKPERRYATARALAEELGRFLNHEPILANPASAARKAASWCRQHPWAITGMAALLVMGLMGLAFGLWQQTQFLAWQHKHPETHLTSETVMDLNARIGKASVFLIPLAVFFYSRLQSRRRLPEKTRRNAMWFGVINALLGVGMTLELIRRVVWSPWTTAVLLSVAIMAFVICWSGLILIWTYLREKQVLRLETDAQTRSFKLEMNPIPLLFGFPMVGWVASWIGGWLFEGRQFQAPQGNFADPTYVWEQAAFEKSLLIMFPYSATLIAMLVPMILAACRSPRGSFWRETSPLAIGVSLSFLAMVFSWIPTEMAASALLLGLSLGWLLSKLTNLRKAAVPKDARPDAAVINEQALYRAFPKVAACLAILACGYPFLFGKMNESLSMLVGRAFVYFLVLSILAAVCGTVSAICSSYGRKGWTIFFGIAFFLFFVGSPNKFPLFSLLRLAKWLIEGWAILVPTLIAGFVLYRAARQPVSASPNETAQPPKLD